MLGYGGQGPYPGYGYGPGPYPGYGPQYFPNLWPGPMVEPRESHPYMDYPNFGYPDYKYPGVKLNGEEIGDYNLDEGWGPYNKKQEGQAGEQEG